jgi:hypothetical protein
MSTVLRRVLLVITALTAVYVGAWALFAPLSWFEAFPGLGMRWLPPLGPYNEHFARDVGALYLGMAAISVAAALRPGEDFLVRTVAVGWLLFSVPHLIFHLVHLDMYGRLDQVLNVIALGYFVLMGLALLLPVRGRAVSVSPAGAGPR